MGRQLWQTSPLIVGFLQLSHGWSKPVCIFGVFNVKMVWHTINIVCHYCCGRGGSRTHLSITAQPHLSRVAHYRSVHLPICQSSLVLWVQSPDGKNRVCDQTSICVAINCHRYKVSILIQTCYWYSSIAVICWDGYEWRSIAINSNRRNIEVIGTTWPKYFSCS